MSFSAKYNGICANCDGPILVGQEIYVDESHNWVHEECPDPLENKAEICPKCFLTKPCEHDE